MQNHVIHIGLGKVASSSIQKQLIPLIKKKHENYFYISPFLNQSTLLKIKMYLKHGKYEVELKKIFSEKKVFLSYEGLISWDPIYWDYSINRLHLLTGSCVKIIVGFRQNESYFKSIYKQALASDVRRLPDSFFIDDLSKGREAIYSNISFSKSHYKPKILIEKLEKYFNSVLSFQLENDGLNLFKKEFNITFDNPPRVNISYTTFGLNIMLLRVKFLSLFKLKGFEYFHKWGDFKINEISGTKNKFRISLFRLNRKLRVVDRVLRFSAKIKKKK